MTHVSRITPCLWFDFKAEEAVAHYASAFKSSKTLEVARYNDAMPQFAGKVLSIRFELNGREFLAVNGGPQFPFTEAISLSVECTDQAEVDELWTKLSEGGAPGQCGWLKDKFGLSWQVVPAVLPGLLRDADQARVMRVMGAMLQMKKLDIAALEAAYRGDAQQDEGSSR